MRSRSSSPRRTASSSAAHSTRSSRESGNRRPLGSPPTAWPERPTRCSSAEIARGVAIWHTRSTCPMSMPSSSEEVATSAFSSPRFSSLLGVEALLARQAAVVRGDLVFSQTIGQRARQALRQAPGVHEYQSGSMLVDQLHQPFVDLPPDLRRHHRFEGDSGTSIARSRLRVWPVSRMAQPETSFGDWAARARPTRALSVESSPSTDACSVAGGARSSSPSPRPLPSREREP